MTIHGYDQDDPIPIAIFAEHLKPPRSTDCLRKWQRQGVVNRFTNLRVQCEMSRLPNGGWAVSLRQYEQFRVAVNQKP